MAKLSYDDRLSDTTGFIDFRQTLPFQRVKPIHALPPLPSASVVRTKYNGNVEGRVSFPELCLFVTYGPPFVVAMDEARVLQVLRGVFLDGQVLVSDLYAWRSEGGINYIYRSLFPGSTLESVWSTVSIDEKDRIATQADQIATTLRSLRQEPNDELIGLLPLP